MENASMNFWKVECLSVCEADGSDSEELKKCPSSSPAVL